MAAEFFGISLDNLELCCMLEERQGSEQKMRQQEIDAMKYSTSITSNRLLDPMLDDSGCEIAAGTAVIRPPRKTCNCCQKEKTLDKFRKNKKYRDGRHPMCIVCCRDAWDAAYPRREITFLQSIKYEV